MVWWPNLMMNMFLNMKNPLNEDEGGVGDLILTSI
jgi:hypothetical protein